MFAVICPSAKSLWDFMRDCCNVFAKIPPMEDKHSSPSPCALQNFSVSSCTNLLLFLSCKSPWLKVMVVEGNGGERLVVWEQIQAPRTFFSRRFYTLSFLGPVNKGHSTLQVVWIPKPGGPAVLELWPPVTQGIVSNSHLTLCLVWRGFPFMKVWHKV